MSLWREDLSHSSLEEILESQAENRVWGKELRRKASALVNSRLAKDISQADYLSNRDHAHEDTVEFRRRAVLLQTQLVLRTSLSLNGGN